MTNLQFVTYKPSKAVEDYLHGVREPGKSKWGRRILWALRHPLFFETGATLADLSDVLGYATSNLVEHRDALYKFELITIDRTTNKHYLTPSGTDYIDAIAEEFGLNEKFEEWAARWQEAQGKIRTETAEYEKTKSELKEALRMLLKYLF